MSEFCFDPEQRKHYLRKLHRVPLRQIMFDMFGRDAYHLLAKLGGKAHRNEDGYEEGFERMVRTLLWHCKQIVGPRARSRRIAYVQACAQDMNELKSGACEAEQANPIALLAEIAGIEIQQAQQHFGDLLNAMFWRMQTRAYEDDDGTWLGKRACTIIRKAAKKRYPIRYLKVVMFNESLDRRKYERARR